MSKKWTWLGLGWFCVTLAFAQVEVEIIYASRAPIRFDVPALNAYFNQFRDMLQSFEDDLEVVGNPMLYNVNADFNPDTIIEFTGITGSRVDVKVIAFGGDILTGKFRCLGLKNPRIDVDLNWAQARATYDLGTGLRPWGVDLIGFDVDIQLGISFCVVAPLFAPNLEEDIEDLVRDWAGSSLDGLTGLGATNFTFMNLAPFLALIPQSVFNAINLNRADFINLVLNPFNGIFIRTHFDINENPTSNDHRLIITVDVPWESPPVPRFIWSYDGFRATFNASASYDPDGGSITRYEWDYGDGTVRSLTTPISTHIYQTPGIYRVTLKTIDNEGARATTFRTVNICSNCGDMQ